MGEELLSLRWNNHQNHFVDILTFLREQEIFIDVTLACGGKLYPAHKFVLSTCSDYFKEMFTKNPNKHPIVFLKDVLCKDLEALLDFMYNGEVNVPQTSLGSLIKTAEGLQIKGLAVPDDPPLPKKDPSSKDKRDIKSRPHSNNSPSPKRLRVRDKSPSLNSSKKSSINRESELSENIPPVDSVDECSRTSAQSTLSDNLLSNLNSNTNIDNENEFRTNNQSDANQSSNNVERRSNSEPSPGPSGLLKSKEEVLEIKQEEEFVDLGGDDDDGNWGKMDDEEDGGGGQMDDDLLMQGGTGLSEGGPSSFSDLLAGSAENSSVTATPNDAAMFGSLSLPRLVRPHILNDSPLPLHFQRPLSLHHRQQEQHSQMTTRLPISDGSDPEEFSRPHTCQFCSSKFKMKQHLTQHLRLHTGEKPYKCKVCNTSYSQLTPLRRHVAKYHG